MSLPVPERSDRTPRHVPEQIVTDLHSYTGIGQPMAWITRQWQSLMEWLTSPAAHLLRPLLRFWVVRQVPNVISTLRIIGSVVVAIWMSQVGPYAQHGLPLIFAILVVLTDGIDGSLARGLAIESTYGKAVDPLADKIFFVSFAFALLAHLNDQRINGLVYMLVAIEFLVAITGTLVGAAARQTDTLPPGASNWGKHKFTMECFALLMGWAITDLHQARLGTGVCLLIALPLAIASLYTYLQQYRNLVKLPRH